MDRERFQLLDRLLRQALAVDAPARLAFVERACGADAELRAQLLRLLAVPPETTELRGGVEAAAATLVPGTSDTPPSIPGYEVRRVIGAGGMGVVYEAFDHDLGRGLAIKVLHATGDGGTLGSAAGDPHGLERFLAEAQVTGQLDHPGVVPVYELGSDATAKPYFAMRLVAGRTADQVFALTRARREGWTLTRALEVVLKICDTMAYAHAKGVVHRDLKPANVMVGQFGEVYVLDWGVARDAGRDLAGRDGRPAADVRAGSAGSAPRADPVLGTPSYMSPEQAAGQGVAPDTRSDVYAVGACVYTLLTGQPPYVAPGSRAHAHEIVAAVRAGPPRPVAAIDPTVPAELAAICEKAMARDPAARYATMQELADELRAFLGERVVKAYRTGAVAELRKWIRRNRGMAAGLLATFLTAVLGAVGIAFYAVRADESARLAERKSREATGNLDRFLELADLVVLGDLRREADRLWPEVPELVPVMDEWLRRADELVARRPPLERALAEVLARGRPLTPDEAAAARRQHPAAETLAQKQAWLARFGTKIEEGRATSRATSRDRTFLDETASETQATVARLSAEIEASLRPRFAMASDRFLCDALSRLLGELAEFADPAHGLIAAIHARRHQASIVRERTLVAEQAAWRQAIASIGDIAACPRYAGLRLTPQLGLVPLRRDPESGLWEFWHPRSGARPVLDNSGRWSIADDTGIVFVLLPGGTFWMGSQRRDRDQPNYMEDATYWQQPITKVELAPFLLARHELTQGQWQAVRGANPASFGPGKSARGHAIRLSHPVESVSWIECMATARQLGLALPTEAQWEYACRAGTDTPWYTGRTVASLQGFANLADEGSASSNAAGWPFEPGFDDGYSVHAPVGSYLPNAFGLHDMAGNVGEWCRDEFGSYQNPPRPGDGLREGVLGMRAYRGGNFNTLAAILRSSVRGRDKETFHSHTLGCRLARAIEP